MLTDEQIRALLEDCESDKGKPWLVHLWESDLSAKVVAELCTRLLDAEALVKHGDIKDAADYLVEALEQQEKEAMRARVKVLEDALRSVTDWKDAAEVVAPELGGMHKAMFAARKALEGK